MHWLLLCDVVSANDDVSGWQLGMTSSEFQRKCYVVSKNVSLGVFWFMNPYGTIEVKGWVRANALRLSRASI